MISQGLLSRSWVYLKRGYAQFAFLLSIANFLVIQYRLLVEPTLLHVLFPRFWIWVAVVLSTGLPIAILLGRWDYRRFSGPAEMAIATRANPFTRDSLEAQIAIIDTLIELTNNPEMKQQLQRAKEILRKWIE